MMTTVSVGWSCFKDSTWEDRMIFLLIQNNVSYQY